MTLRYKWIIWAMFMVPGLEPVLPSGRLSQKMFTYHLDRAPWLVTKTHIPLRIIKQGGVPEIMMVIFVARAGIQRR